MSGILRPFPNRLITGSGNQIKPYGPVKIDWRHPLANNLVSYWFDQVGAGAGFVDLVSGSHTIANAASGGALPVLGTTRFGAGPNVNALADIQDKSTAQLQNLAAPYSFAVGFCQTATPVYSANNTEWFTLSDNVGPNIAFGLLAGTTTQIAPYFANASLSGVAYAPINNSFDVVVGAASPTTGFAYAQGKLLGSNVQTTFFTPANPLYYTFNQDHFSSLFAVVFFAAVWYGRQLTLQDAQQLFIDPYCFLLPAGEAELPALSSGAAAGFSMAAATGNYAFTNKQELLKKASIGYSQAISFTLTDEAEKLEKGSFYKPQAGFYLLNSAALTAFDPSNAGTTIALSNANLTATGITSTANSIVRSVAKESSGKFYCEFTCTSASANATGVGICDGSEILNGVSLGADLNGLGFENSNGTTGHVYINNNPTAIQGYNNGDNVGMAVDFDDKTIWLRTNGGNWNNDGAANPATNTNGIDISSLNAGPYYASVNTFAVGDAITVNFGATAYSYTSPSGFFNWGAFTGGNEKLTKASKLTAQSTPYALTDEQLTALRTATANLQTDFYALTGGSPTLTFSIITAFNIVLSTGVYALTDESETLKAGRLDKAQTIQYALTDEQLLTLQGRRAKIQTNYYALTIEQEKILKKSLLFPQEMPFAFMGGIFSLTTTTSLQILLSTGTYALTDENEKLLKQSQVIPFSVPYAENAIKDARSFNGFESIQPSASSSLLNPQTCTMAAWIYVDGENAANYGAIMGCFDGTAAHNHVFYAEAVGLARPLSYCVLSFYVGAGQIDNTGAAARFSPYTWVHAAATISSGGTVLTTYLNGVQDQQVTIAAYTPTAAPFFIGNDSMLDLFAGNIADPAIWNTVLTPTQIANLAAGQRANTIGANANLVGYWPFYGTSPEHDESGFGNDGVLTGTQMVIGPPLLDPSFYAVLTGNETLLKGSKDVPLPTSFGVNSGGIVDARSFNGSDFITVPAGFSMPTGPITIAGWVNQSASGTAQAIFAGVNLHTLMILIGGTGIVNIWSIFDGAQLLGVTPLLPGVWTHVVATVSAAGIGAAAQIYLNGNLSASGAINYANVTGSGASIGYSAADNFYFLNGSLADMAVWNTVLTSTDIANLAGGQRANAIGANVNLVGYWPILNQSPEPDESGNSNDGTLTGTMRVAGPPALAPFVPGSILGSEMLLKTSTLLPQVTPFNTATQRSDGGGPAELLLWDHADKTQSVPYNINQSPTDLARAFNGTTDYIDLGTHTWDPTTSATFASWVYIVALPASYAGLFSTNNPNSAIFYLRNSGDLAFYIFNNWGNAANDPLLGGPTLSTGQWYHLAWTVVSGGNLNFYLNGTLNGSFAVGTGGGGSSIEQALLGQDITSGLLYPFNGYMSDIALWNTVLTGTQISNLAAGQRANTIATSNLIMNLPITGASPEPDVSGPQGRYGTLNGTSIAAGPPTLQSYTPIEGYETLLKDSVDYPQAGFYNLKVESITLSTLVPFLMVLGTGTYLLTDESLVLIKTSRLGAQTGIYSLNDEQLRTLKGSQLKDTAGTYSIVGEQLTLKAARKANLQATFYNLAGEAVTLIAPAGAFAMNIGTGAYVLTDETLTLLKGSHLYPQRVPYNITEFNTIIPQSFFLFPNTAYYALTDEQETLLKASTNNVQVGTYQLTDEQLALLKGLKLQGTAGFYTFNGEQLTLKATRLDHPQTGLYNLIEPSFSLTIPGQFFMTVTSGSYAVTDENETLLRASHVSILPISYAFTVETEQTLRAAATFPQAGSYALTPEQLREIKKSRMSAQAVTYSLVIENEQLLRGRTISVPSGSYTLTGKQIIDAITAITMNLKPGNYALTVEALKVTTTAPSVTVIFTASPVLIGRDAVTNLLGRERVPELEGEI